MGRIKRASGYSIKLRTILALFALVAMQGLVLIVSIGITGATQKSDSAAYKILSNQTLGRKNEIQSEFNTRRKNLVNLATDLGYSVSATLRAYGLKPEELPTDMDAFNDVLNISIEALVPFTKYSKVTGAFVVLDTSENVAGDAASRTSVYLRDSSPELVNSRENSLLLEYGAVDIARAHDVAVNHLWTRDMSFGGGAYRDFYYKPVKAALEMPPQENLQVYGYWSPPFKLRKDDVTIVTYSLPLVLDDGTVIGVLGFDLEETYLSGMMSSAEIPFDRGFYLLGVDSGIGLYNDDIIASGVYANYILSGHSVKLDFDFIYQTDTGPTYEISNPQYPDNTVIGGSSVIDLYETYSPFYNEKWTFICAAPKASIMSGSNSIKNAITTSIVSTILLVFVLAFFTAVYLFDPLQRLYEKVRSIDPEKPVRFDRTGISEIDELSGAFEVLSDNVSEAAARMFKIVELVDMPLGSFEIEHTQKRVRMSKSLFTLLDFEMPKDGSFIISEADWTEVISTFKEINLTKNEDGITEILYMTERGPKKWLRMRIIAENMRNIGVLIDVTDDVLQKQRLEFDRNFDSLTQLLNRRAFIDRTEELLRKRSDTIGLMMFADLDDLKFVNDMYGHNVGDQYIKAFSSFLGHFRDHGAEVGRMSGDEFVVFMNGFQSKDEARNKFNELFHGIKDVFISVPGGTSQRLRASVGIAYYPLDSSDVNELIKYADYAMYEIKHTVKGEIREFDIDAYNKNSFVISMKNVLNMLIEEERIQFAFQPIVDVRTGEIFAYEALMRSTIRDLEAPEDILKIGRSQSKLYQLELLTVNVALDWVDNNIQRLGDRKIFVNSIAGQLLTNNDFNMVVNSYHNIAKHVVFEITENEFSNTDETQKKASMIRSFGAMVAIDDYGSGYSNELALLSIAPDFLKIDMNIIRGIDRDPDKQQLVTSLIGYTEKRGIKIIAEGVETAEELRTLIDFGIVYIQGYYFSKPEFELDDIPQNFRSRIL